MDIDLDRWYELHLKKGGKHPREAFDRKKQYVLTRPAVRPVQRYLDYSIRSGPALPREKGERFNRYVSFVGLRADEPQRVYRTKGRNDPDKPWWRYMPLADMGITTPEVNAFWQGQDFNLGLPEGGFLSNCVFCFLKGPANLQKAFHYMEDNPIDTPPGNPDWWVGLERKYQKNFVEEGRELKPGQNGVFGFWGPGSKLNYEYLFRGLGNRKGKPAIDIPDIKPCDCTD